jgi:hypothetical protein
MGLSGVPVWGSRRRTGVLSGPTMFAVRATALALFTLSAVARAEPSLTTVWTIATVQPVAVASATDHACSGLSLDLFAADALALPGWLPAFAAPDAHDTFAEAPTQPAGVIPPPPSSRSLALSGLAAAAGLQLLRRIHLPGRAMLPDWYATSGPHQVGHATPLVLGCESAAWPVMPALHANVQPPARPACGWYLHPEPEEAPLHQRLLSPAAPRGPPSCAPIPRLAA